MSATNRLKPCLIIAGPTASGKSWLAEKLAIALDGLIINGDSMQVYAGLRVITAQPDPDSHQRLYGVLQPTEMCSAAHWRELALAEIKAAYALGKQPLVVGGTGLYLKTLMEGLSPIPEVSGTVREEARQLCDRLGVEAFHEELARIDPEGAQKLNPQDTQRLIRAYEVKVGTGKSILSWQSKAREGAPYSFYRILVLPPKADLDARITERFNSMVTQGALEEVKALKVLDQTLPACKAIGVPELGAYLDGRLTLEKAIEKAIIASRQLAKRQGTWFRNQFKGDTVIDHCPDEGDLRTLLTGLQGD